MISTPTLILREIAHRRKTSSLLVGLVAVMIGAVTFFSVNRTGYEKEMTRTRGKRLTLSFRTSHQVVSPKRVNRPCVLSE